MKKSDTVDVTNKKVTQALERLKIEVKPDMLERVIKTINEARDDTAANDAIRQVITLSEGVNLHLHIYD